MARYTAGPTADRVRALLDYDHETGRLVWRESRGSVAAGQAAAKKQLGRYLWVRIDRKSYAAHRIAWLHAFGEWPLSDIDHRDGDGTNNSLSNLRLASASQNSANAKLQRRNTSGFKGVHWHSEAKRWRACIWVNYRRLHLGYFDAPEEAHAAYCSAAREQFGEFARAV